MRIDVCFFTFTLALELLNIWREELQFGIYIYNLDLNKKSWKTWLSYCFKWILFKIVNFGVCFQLIINSLDYLSLSWIYFQSILILCAHFWQLCVILYYLRFKIQITGFYNKFKNIIRCRPTSVCIKLRLVQKIKLGTQMEKKLINNLII